MSDEARSDPLYRHTALTHKGTYPVFGHSVNYATNSDRVFSRIEDAYGSWRDLAPVYCSKTSFAVNVVLHEGDEDGQVPQFTYRMPSENRLLVTTHGSQAVVEIDRHLAYAYVTSELVQHSASLRAGILDSMTLMLTTSVDRCPIHAAAVKSEDQLMLLTGASGSGKSTVSYALLSMGYEVLSDDTVYVQMDPHPRIWHAPGIVSLLPAAASDFSELRDVEPQRLPTGKTKVVIPLPVRTAHGPFVGSPIVCLLRRGQAASLARLTPDEVHTSLAHAVEPGFSLLAEQRVSVAKWLSENGGWQLTLSSHAEAAIPLIREILAS